MIVKEFLSVAKKASTVYKMENFVECAASVFVRFGSKERHRYRIFGFFPHERWGAKKGKRGQRKGKERNACRQIPGF